MGAKPLKDSVIILRRVAYSDRHSVITAWSRNYGRVSLLANDVAPSRSATRLRALLAPPAIVDCIIHKSPNREIFPISDVVSNQPLLALRMSPLKTMVATFLAEVMASMLIENQPDDALWNFITDSLKTLDGLNDNTAIANFHLCFLYKFGALLGVEPDVSTWRDGRRFDIIGGIFLPSSPNDASLLSEEESRTLMLISRMNFRNIHLFKFSRQQRQRVLDVELAYLKHHLARRGVSLKSLDVLRSLMD